MAFFDEIGKKISQTGQEAVKQTKIMANVTKYKANISALENKVRDAFTLIGKQYFQDHQNDPEAEQIDKINEVAAYLKEIEEWKFKIQQEKGVVVCQQCGAEVNMESVFCNNCGAKVEKPKPPVVQENTVICPNCGSQVAEGSAFCTSCGNKMEAPQQAEETDPETAAPEEEKQEKVCPQCGSRLSDDAKFCVNCGCKIE